MSDIDKHPRAECLLELQSLVSDKLDPMSEKLTVLTTLVQSMVDTTTALDATVRGKNLDNGLVLQAAQTVAEVKAVNKRLDNMLTSITSSEKDTKTTLVELNKVVHGWAKPIMGWLIGAYIALFSSMFALVKWVDSQLAAIEASIK